MGIKFSELKQKKVRKIIDNVGYENPIEIYNVTEDIRPKVTKIITNNMDGKTGELNIEARLVIVELLPMLSNVDLDLDLEKDKEQINEILDNPSEILLQIVDEITEVIKEFTERFIKNIDKINQLSPEEFNKLFNKKDDEKEKRKQELLKELESLEKDK